ncbi:uncharacterized protein At5g19025 [Amborella trichopoda]|uniref:Ribosomal protein L34e superfamily protein n=1 Tax=Amborella trichopoda TaxID=13333 RepID=W1NND3_AMBTC|nr:uncharacterized protein At5g19025 [Amborella trichopoda]ERM97247.1 hypothetical protein AMTR_s00119p00095770 [Amborella trichopoda]|eukprot:XP_006829831.1 uncharacterized protein At5g19025 [Amborella trichopoda]
MVDCRSLIEFCKAFEQHRNMANSQAMSDQLTHHKSSSNHSKNKKSNNSLNPLSHPLCDQSPFAAIDIVVLLLVIGAFGFLLIPYFKFVYHEAAEILPAALYFIGDIVYNAPVAYALGAILMFVAVIATWEIYSYKMRKCENPHCRGLRKAIEFDIQLESEECVKYLPPVPKDAFGARPLELGQDHKELEAELKRMAPPNGRAVLIFRAPCGCPAGRMEVWGAKKLRRIKK